MEEQVLILVQALSKRCCRSIEDVMSIFQQSVVIKETGKKAIELTIVEKKLGLPDGFFAQAAGIKQAPVALTTEACIEG